jgi:hypothetical protein
MTPEQISEIQRIARQNAKAQQSGWPTKGNPYSNAEKATIYQRAFDAAARELKELRR